LNSTIQGREKQIDMRQYLTVLELSEYIKRSPGAIRNLVMRRRIPFRKPAGRLLFDQSEIDRWIQQSEGISLNAIEETRE
jgi:excisionase family DNA binding protein